MDTSMAEDELEGAGWRGGRNGIGVRDQHIILD